MSGNRFAIADAARVESLLRAMALRLHASIPPPDGDDAEIVLIGLLRRGVPIAQRLAGVLERELGRRVRTGALELKRYGENLELLYERPHLDDAPLDVAVRGARVVLVDDVLYTGRTLLRATEHLEKLGAARIHAAVVCERDGRELPVRADFVGTTLEVGPGGIVDVSVPPYEQALAIHLRHARGIATKP
jgi:pyrimidine operon attenuation protein/uracil phosphoribosyltransferase